MRLDTGDGHILVALIVFVVGVFMEYLRIDGGKEVVVGSLASLWTSLRGRSISQKPPAGSDTIYDLR